MIAAIFATEIGRSALVAVGAFLAGFFYCWSNVPEVDVPAIQRAASDARDAEWSRKLAAERETNEQRLAAAVEAAKSEPDTPADMDERLRLCRASATCRDKDRR